MSPRKGLWPLLFQVSAAGVLLIAGVLSGCAADVSIQEESNMAVEPTDALIATIRSLDAAMPGKTETATLALG